MTRIEHYNDLDAPRSNRLIPAASAVVADENGRILMARRRGNSLWTIPGGVMEPGESIAQTAVREVKEETGLDVEVVSLVGIYSSPHHIVEYADGEVRQQFSVCFACRPVGGDTAPSERRATSGSTPPRPSRRWRSTRPSASGSSTSSPAGQSPTSADRPALYGQPNHVLG